MDISEELRNALKHPQAARIIKSKPRLLEEIHDSIGGEYSLVEKVWMLKNGRSSPPSCLNGSAYKWVDGSVGYRFCGRPSVCACAKENHSKKISQAKQNMSSEDIKRANERRRNTVMSRYGVEHISQDAQFRERVEATSLAKYGKKTNLLNEEVIERIKSTNVTRYGSEVPSKNEMVARKISATHAANGGTFLSRRDEFALRMKERHGVEHALQKPEFLEKRNRTTEQRWGSSNHMQNPEVLARLRETNNRRFGVPHNKQIGYSENDLRLVSDLDFFKSEYARLGVDGLLVHYGVSRAVIRNHLVESGIDYDRGMTSSEQIVFNTLRAIYDGPIEFRCRSLISPLEVDFYLPEMKLAVEVCGLYWHSEGRGKTRTYHRNKMVKCAEKDVRLITIFDDELSDVALVQKKLSHILGKSQRICSARQTQIREISVEAARDFLSKNHIQGYCRSRIKLGAYYGDELVAVMTFGNARVSLGSSRGWELIRMASVGSIPGIASKLFRYFVRNYDPDEIVSYCDLRWGTGSVYRELGMEYSHASAPGYWYLDSRFQTRFHRYIYTKGRLVREGHDRSLSEWQIMRSNGFDRIWDCGHGVWKWIKKEYK